MHNWRGLEMLKCVNVVYVCSTPKKEKKKKTFYKFFLRITRGKLWKFPTGTNVVAWVIFLANSTH